MEGVPIFLNEMSAPIEADGHELKEIVLLFLRTLQIAQEKAGLIYLGAEVPLASLQLTVDYRTLGSVLQGDREWWRFLQSLEQRSPYSAVPQSLAPSPLAHTEPTGLAGQALLWSAANESFVASFPSAEEWQMHEIVFNSCICDTGDHSTAVVTTVRNLSRPVHSEHWSEELRTFTYCAAVSSIVYEGDNFLLKMFLNDHNPPHVHVYERRISDCIALVRFDIEPEVLRGNGLKGALRTEVLGFLADNRDALMVSWAECRAGNHPNAL